MQNKRLEASRALMELYQLRTFTTVASARHLTRAAERLHLSQPAVSAHVKSLEDALGVRLFERRPDGMQLTHAGRELLAHAEHVLAAVRDMERAAHALSGRVAGHLRVGTVTDPEFIRLGELLARALERHPLIEIELQSEVSGAAFEAVRDGALDASFYFAALPWIVTPRVSTHTHLANAFFGEQGAHPARVIEADNEALIGNLVAAGVGMSLLREDVALRMQAAGEACVWGDERLRTTLWFVYRAAREREAPLAALLEVLRETWGLAPIGVEA